VSGSKSLGVSSEFLGLLTLGFMSVVTENQVATRAYPQVLLKENNKGVKLKSNEKGLRFESGWVNVRAVMCPNLKRISEAAMDR